MRDDGAVRRAVVQTLGKLDATSLATHVAPALVERLQDSSMDVREAVVQTLDKLDAASLATYVPAIVAKLEAIVARFSSTGIRECS